MSEIKPALTADQWTSKSVSVRDDGADEDGYFDDGSRSERGWTVMYFAGQVFVSAADNGPPYMIGLSGGLRHPTAALCLHDQPFGFTRSDIRLLRSVVSCVWSSIFDAVETQHEIESLAGRIEALLPPEPDADG